MKYIILGIVILLLSGCIDYTDYTAYVDSRDNSILYTRGDCFIYYNNYTNTVKASHDSHCDEEDFTNYWSEQNKIGRPEPYIPPTPSPVPTPVPVRTPVPTPIRTPTPTPEAQDNTKDAWAFIHYVQNNWVYETDVKGEIVQTPQVSYSRLSGDCDDFATMVAYYLEEVYGYDTELMEIITPSGGGHLVAFVQVLDTYPNKMAKECNVKTFPYYTDKDGMIYAPIDWKVCPGWTWGSLDKIKTHEWEYYMGLAV